jgi:nudix-type nucleoside diphosphatase (YffH/AdpP family)
MRITAVTVIFEGWLKLLSAAVQGRSGNTFGRLIEDHGSAVAILPYDPVHRKVLAISQFRPPVDYASPGHENVIEPIAGRIDDGDPDASARREALEEAGVAIGSLELLTTCWTMPAISTERIHLYLARYSPEDRVSDGGGLAEEDEDIIVHEMSFEAMRALVETNRGVDLKLIALFYGLERKLGERRQI